MTVGIACPNCRALVGVANANIDAGKLLATTFCPECQTVFSSGTPVDVIVPVLVEGGKRQLNIKE